ncbi:MAG: DUF1579 domain-containing protein [Planctomycetota bacterium]
MTGRKLGTGIVVLAVALLLLGTRVISQDKGTAQPPKDDEMSQMMDQGKALNAKGAEHEKFAKAVGKWKTITKMWKGPGTEPTVSEGTAEFRTLLDGRYLEQKYQCDMMGESYEGIGIEGYDLTKKKYVSIWMDNTSTGIYMTTGTPDKSGKVITYIGKMDDPMSGQKDKVVKYVAREINPDHLVFEMYDTMPDGKEFKTMEIVYMRAK